jgi:hypothetical protein
LLFQRKEGFKLIFQTVQVVLKRIWLFGRATFQPFDRDLNQEEWVAILDQAGFSIQNLVHWPNAPEKPLVYLVHCRVK